MVGVDPGVPMSIYGAINFPAIVGLLLTFILLFVSAKWVRESFGLRLESSRKYVHVGAMVTGAILPIALTRSTLMIAATIFVPILIFLASRNLLPGVVDRNRSIFGPVMALCAYVILLVVAPTPFYIAVPMAVAGLADGTAGLIGSRTSVRRMSGSHRSWLGTGSGFAVAWIVVAIALATQAAWPVALAHSVVIAAVVSSIEVTSSSKLDNISVPLGTFIALKIAAYWQVDEALLRLLELMLCVAVAVFATRRRWLTVPGGFALVVVAMATFWTVGWRGIVVLAAFFVASSMLTKIRPDRAVQDDGKNGRSVRQVFAIGAAPVIFGIMAWNTGSGNWELAFVTAVAVACADTFATEIGRFSKHEPFLITSMRYVPRGTSGAISALGTLASLLGAGFVGITAALTGLIDHIDIILVLLLGAAGALADSLLGAALQEKWICHECQVVMEVRPSCHANIRRASGAPFLNNEAVNFLTVTLFGFCSTIAGSSL